jgi:hypothetical protein
LHDEKFARESSFLESGFQGFEVAGKDRAYVGVDGGRADSFIEPDFRQDFTRE